MIDPTDPHMAAQLPRLSLSHGIICPEACGNDLREAVRDWQAHVDAGRIGTAQPLSDEQLANLVATEIALGLRRAGGVS